MPNETTPFTDPSQKLAFELWSRMSGIQDRGRANYDYQGFFNKYGPVKYQWGKDHLPDEFKQHGHEKFSAESKYSRGPQDGGQWIGETLIEPPVPSHTKQPNLLELLLQRGSR